MKEKLLLQKYLLSDDSFKKFKQLKLIITRPSRLEL